MTTFSAHKEEIAAIENHRNGHLQKAEEETKTGGRFEASQAHSLLAINYQMQIAEAEAEYARQTRRDV